MHIAREIYHLWAHLLNWRKSPSPNSSLFTNLPEEWGQNWTGGEHREAWGGASIYHPELHVENSPQTLCRWWDLTLGLASAIDADQGSNSILSICLSQPGIPDWRGLQFLDSSIGSIAPGKLNEAQLKYLKDLKYYLNPGLKICGSSRVLSLGNTFVVWLWQEQSPCPFYQGQH